MTNDEQNNLREVMEAQDERVLALEAMNHKLRGTLELARHYLSSIRIYSIDTLSGRTDGPDDRAWQRAAVNELAKRARLGLEAIDSATGRADDLTSLSDSIGRQCEQRIFPH